MEALPPPLLLQKYSNAILERGRNKKMEEKKGESAVRGIVPRARYRQEKLQCIPAYPKHKSI